MLRFDRRGCYGSNPLGDAQCWGFLDGDVRKWRFAVRAPGFELLETNQEDDERGISIP